MGTELTGISGKLMSQVDDYVEIPMYGFSESFNVSVAASIALNRVRTRIEEAGVINGLSEEEKQKLRMVWAYKTVKDAKAILMHYGKELPFEI